MVAAPAFKSVESTGSRVAGRGARDGILAARSSVLAHCPSAAPGGWMMVELLVAVALLAGCLLPLAYSITSERRYARAIYRHAVAMEIVDGEVEALAAGQWRAFSNGVCEYKVRAGAATNLPPGRFLLTLQPGQLRLEWRPDTKQLGGSVVREAMLK